MQAVRLVLPLPLAAPGAPAPHRYVSVVQLYGFPIRTNAPPRLQNTHMYLICLRELSALFSLGICTHSLLSACLQLRSSTTNDKRSANGKASDDMGGVDNRSVGSPASGYEASASDTDSDRSEERNYTDESVWSPTIRGPPAANTDTALMRPLPPAAQRLNLNASHTEQLATDIRENYEVTPADRLAHSQVDCHVQDSTHQFSHTPYTEDIAMLPVPKTYPPTSGLGEMIDPATLGIESPISMSSNDTSLNGTAGCENQTLGPSSLGQSNYTNYQNNCPTEIQQLTQQSYSSPGQPGGDMDFMETIPSINSVQTPIYKNQHQQELKYQEQYSQGQLASPNALHKSPMPPPQSPHMTPISPHRTVPQAYPYRPRTGSITKMAPSPDMTPPPGTPSPTKHTPPDRYQSYMQQETLSIKGGNMMQQTYRAHPNALDNYQQTVGNQHLLATGNQIFDPHYFNTGGSHLPFQTQQPGMYPAQVQSNMYNYNYT